MTNYKQVMKAPMMPYSDVQKNAIELYYKKNPGYSFFGVAILFLSFNKSNI